MKDQFVQSTETDVKVLLLKTVKGNRQGHMVCSWTRGLALIKIILKLFKWARAGARETNVAWIFLCSLQLTDVYYLRLLHLKAFSYCRAKLWNILEREVTWHPPLKCSNINYWQKCSFDSFFFSLIFLSVFNIVRILWIKFVNFLPSQIINFFYLFNRSDWKPFRWIL